MFRQFVHFCLFATALTVPGCSRWLHKTDGNYQTIIADPNRDTERAYELNARALRLFAKGKLEQAEQALQQALIADVTFGPAHNNLGKHYFNQHKLYLAAWEFEYAMKLMPDRPEPYNNLGLVYEAAGKYGEAIEMFHQAADIDKSNAEYLGNLIRARLRSGDQQDELRDLLEHLVFLDSRPDWVDWAEEKLALMNSSRRQEKERSDPPETLPKPPELQAPESIPAPESLRQSGSEPLLDAEMVPPQIELLDPTGSNANVWRP